ncbi:DUF547 domain-containing protein [Flavivirga algicola]|uniref:DUF547 domain-containing protein n=1 Tax=Flavivirga algicola TaxID=2729136 RepID=A0ABX1RWB3_9FLAO|nr:DUF547 domain-containing protein [Flavivirga algicola]NMH87290.1 DUF547 domain-containing protein [Flavivirga algicola]
MKQLTYIIVFLFFSCAGSKKVAKEITKPTPVPAAQVKIDTVSTTPSKTIKDTDEQPIETAIKTEKFDQVLTKRILDEHELWNDLLQKYVSKDGNVNYKELKKERKDFYGYLHVLNLMYQHESFKTRSKEQKLAFWINAYNAFTVDLILRNYPLKSIKDLKDPWKQRHWKLGDKWYNLDEIEHQILRKMNEPRIHFAINCASFSCPKLQNKAFTASNLETQLTNATKEFLNDPTKNNLSKNSIKISKLFQWFAKDFKQNGSLIDFLNQYSETKISNKAKKKFKDYNWNLNE